MATLNINGKKVTVGDEFLSLSPEQQNATVDEISQSLNSDSDLQTEPQNATPTNDPIEELQKSSFTNKIGAAVDGVAQGLTFGFSDEIAAGLASATGLGGDFGEYDKNLAAERARMDENKRLAGGYELAGQLAGGVTNAAGLAKNGLLASAKLGAKSGIGVRTGAAALDGAVAGAAFGAGDGDGLEGRTQGAIQGATIGGLTGGAVGNVAARIARSKVAKEMLPATDEIKAAAQSLYKEAEQAQVAFNQGFYNRLVSSARMAVGRTHVGLHPKTQAAMDVLEKERGRVLSLSEVDELRQVVGNAVAGADPADARLLGKIVDRLDTFVDNAKPSDISGNRNGVNLLKEARQLWGKQAKLKVVDEIIEKAKNQATGFENGLRVQFRQLANNPKRFKKFSAAEQKAIKRIVRGGPVENILRAVGWLSPTGVFGSLLTGGAVVGGGVLPGATLAGAGYAGRKGAEVLTRGNVANTQRLIATGLNSIPLPAPSMNPSILSQTVSQNIQANNPLRNR